MARQIYFRGEAGPDNIYLPQMPNVSHIQQIYSEGTDILKCVADLGVTFGKAYIHFYYKRRQGLIDDAYLIARNEMALCC